MCLAAALLAAQATRAAGGVGWRGDGTGRYPKADPPVEWDIDDGTNIRWQAVVGKSQSSSVVAGDRVFVTAEQDLLLCLDRKSGKVLWKGDNGFGALPAGKRGKAKRYPTGPDGGYSMPTPVADGNSIYAGYGTGIVVCHDLDGKRRWIRHIDLPQLTDHGRSASPVLAGGKLLVSIGALIALDPATGKTIWQARDAVPSYGTPAVARIGGAVVAVTANGDVVRVSDGAILAGKVARTEFSSPLVHAGVVYFACAPAVAVKLPAVADRRVRPVRLWQNDELEGDFYASPIWHAGVLYCVSNEGLLYALDAKTGKVVYRKRLGIPSADSPPGMESADIYASLTLTRKHLLLCNDVGHTLVLAPGRQYKQLAHNFLDKGSGASPVPSGKCLFLRGGEKLYCIGPKGDAPRRAAPARCPCIGFLPRVAFCYNPGCVVVKTPGHPSMSLRGRIPPTPFLGAMRLKGETHDDERNCLGRPRGGALGRASAVGGR
jgi:outer membrane protein assembly factor BamB